MAILLYPQDQHQDAGFYSFLFDALTRHAGARKAVGNRPLPRMQQPRQHESVWIEWNGIRVLVDMSDHIFLFDLPALRMCDVYLKANLNQPMAEKVLARAGAMDCHNKLRPFMFLPPARLAAYSGLERATRLLRKGRWRPFDFCHVVGVYNNPFLNGVPPEASMDITADPRTNHFWTRYQIQRALQNTGMKGFCRLTNRGNAALLDPKGVVKANLNNRTFQLAMLASRMTVLNTLPHALFPWKALESMALGIPFVAERRPQIMMPEALELVPGRHYLELLPELPGFAESADQDDLRAYRVFPEIRLERLRERAEWLKGEICNHGRMAEMLAEVDSYRRRVLNPPFIAQFFADTVAQAIKGKGVPACGS
ncbi:MAG: hypothetical protein WCL16_07885 [bacterium]